MARPAKALTEAIGHGTQEYETLSSCVNACDTPRTLQLSSTFILSNYLHGTSTPAISTLKMDLQARADGYHAIGALGAQSYQPTYCGCVLSYTICRQKSGKN